jgi:type 1 glutamine amidotransferase
VSNPSNKPRALLLLGQVGEKQFHNTPDHWSALAALLRGLDLQTRVISDDVADLNPDDLSRFDVILNYSTAYEPSSDQVDALLEAIRRGVGFVGLHAATATFKGSLAYFQMIGGRFVKHPPFGRFTVEITDSTHPVTRGMATFDVEDERYELTDLADGLRVLAHNEGHPMVYATEYGQGRVCYIALGHDRRSLTSPEYAQLLTQAVEWVTRQR